jgi:hypothetical protein
MRTTYTLGVAYHHPDLIELGHNLERDLAALGVDRYAGYVAPYGGGPSVEDLHRAYEESRTYGVVRTEYQGNPADAAFKRKCSGTYECPCSDCQNCEPDTRIDFPTLIVLLSIGGMLGCGVVLGLSWIITNLGG